MSETEYWVKSRIACPSAVKAGSQLTPELEIEGSQRYRSLYFLNECRKRDHEI